MSYTCPQCNTPLPDGGLHQAERGVRVLAIGADANGTNNADLFTQEMK
jgi:hypothetical protein